MPHAVLKGPLTPEDIWLAFQPLDFREDEVTYKVQDAYLGHDKETLLVRCLVVERGYSKPFFMKAAQKDADSITIGLETIASPERTEAVQRLIGFAAWRLMQVVPELELVSTNLKDQVRGPKSAP